jgi:hypothetical protein
MARKDRIDLLQAVLHSGRPRGTPVILSITPA